jgi:selenocysteine lyase/cysteine desulfurase
METGDCSVAGRLGLGVAIRLALNLGLDEIREAVRHRAEHLRDRLATVSGIQLHDLGVDMAARGLDEILRASVSYFTTEEEVERFVAILAKTKI